MIQLIASSVVIVCGIGAIVAGVLTIKWSREVEAKWKTAAESWQRAAEAKERRNATIAQVPLAQRAAALRRADALARLSPEQRAELHRRVARDWFASE